MSVRITGGCVVVKNTAIDDDAGGAGIAVLLAAANAATVSRDEALTAVAFGSEAEKLKWIASLRARGIGNDQIAIVDAESKPAGCSWLLVEEKGDGTREAWIEGSPRGVTAGFEIVDRPPYRRLDILSKSDSGLHYTRERRSGVLRVLTEDELRDFSDPRPCEECGEQFGCTHYNCARERLLSEAEIEAEVPEEWRGFARDAGVSREDVGRLRTIVQRHGEYSLLAGTDHDMRTHELLLLLNESW